MSLRHPFQSRQASGAARPIALLLITLSASAAGAANITYTLGPDPGLANSYGFSGTVPTDGSVGSFLDASPIIDWDISDAGDVNGDGFDETS